MSKYKSLAFKLMALLVLAAILPLTLFGMISVWQARDTARQAVLLGNMRVAERAADQINQYVDNSLAILRSTAENVSRADLAPWQRERVIRNMSLEFDEFSEIIIVNTQGAMQSISGVGSSRIIKSPYGEAAIKDALSGKIFHSPVFITDELTPATIVSLPMMSLGEIMGAVVAEVDLLHMWRLVDRIRIGEQGYLSVVSPSGKLIASGSGEMKRMVFQELNYPDTPLLKGILSKPDKGAAVGHRNEGGERLLVAATALPEPFSWTVVMEQPTAEAFALSRKLTWILTGLIAIFVVTMCFLGFFGARWQIVKPVGELIRGTRRIASGDLSYRVGLESQDELGELASSFNRMAGELGLMQDNIRKQERMAFFGRIASGLAHDLKHPVKSIENASRLMDDMYEDPQYRQTFKQVVSREFSKINNFLDNLRTVSHEIPYHPIELNLHSLLDEVVETFSIEAKEKGVELKRDYVSGELKIYADKFSMTRAFSNLVNNAIQAISEAGEVTIRTSEAQDGDGSKQVRVSIADTGCGISPERIETIFSDFVTTKRKGLGLGLALVKRIFDQHDAKIWVDSQVGQGSVFNVSFKPHSV